MDPKNLAQVIDAKLAAMRASLDGAKIGYAVEIGSILASLIKTAEGIQDQIKEALRIEALDRLQHQPGSVTLEGDGSARVVVTVPQPKMRLTKGTDPELLKRVLGDDFDLYLETKVTYVPRPVTGDLIAAMEDGAAKTVMLSAVELAEGTPRVSFK